MLLRVTLCAGASDKQTHWESLGMMKGRPAQIFTNQMQREPMKAGLQVFPFQNPIVV